MALFSADYIIEVGPGPGERGGQIIAQGTAVQLRKAKNSLTGAFLSGARRIEVPSKRRALTGLSLRIKGARANNLRNVNVDIPLGVMTCVTGVSGSGKSTLINEVMFKQLYSHFHDQRIVPGEHDSIEGVEHLTGIINIDQSPIGRSTLFGGEAQRIKLATEISKLKRGSHNLYILDEPTTGLHLHDIQKLIDCMNQLVDNGHSVLVIEHHLDVIKVSDYVIDMGPDGGKDGGTVVAQGTPEQVALVHASHTGKFLKSVLSADNRYWHEPVVKTNA